MTAAPHFAVLSNIHRTTQLRRAPALFRGAGAFGPEPSAGRPAIGHVPTQGDTHAAKVQHSGRKGLAYVFALYRTQPQL